MIYPLQARRMTLQSILWQNLRYSQQLFRAQYWFWWGAFHPQPLNVLHYL